MKVEFDHEAVRVSLKAYQVDGRAGGFVGEIKGLLTHKYAGVWRHGHRGFNGTGLKTCQFTHTRLTIGTHRFRPV